MHERPSAGRCVPLVVPKVELYGTLKLTPEAKLTAVPVSVIDELPTVVPVPVNLAIVFAVPEPPVTPPTPAQLPTVEQTV